MGYHKTNIRFVFQNESETSEDYEERLQTKLNEVNAISNNHSGALCIPMVYSPGRICTLIQWFEVEERKEN